MSTHSKTAQLDQDTALLAGIQKNMPTASFTVLSQVQTEAEVQAVLQGRIDKAQAVATARVALHAAVAACESEYTTTNAYVRSLRNGLVAMYENSPATLSELGLSPRRPLTPLTSAEQVAAVAKRKATRAARHTMGKVQKSAITGSLTGPIVVSPDGSTNDSTSPTPPAASPVKS